MRVWNLNPRIGRSQFPPPHGKVAGGSRLAQVVTFFLGYNLHLSVDADLKLSIVFAVTPANVRDVEEAPDLLRATKRKLPRGE